jgi:hypothetical protein
MQTYIRRILNIVNVSDRSDRVVAKMPLGRWSIHYDQKIIDRKIVQANEDNCGCCEPLPKPINPPTKESDDYLLPYVI